ncbi:hypothetical protein S7335_2448 [Synechococcus sp. PCC 7335]|nr:hypothetical protein S7335_2448 [Synechococcus sp. PCC 7335]
MISTCNLFCLLLTLELSALNQDLSRDTCLDRALRYASLNLAHTLAWTP